MADMASIMRDAVARAAAQKLGLKTNQPTLTSSNQHTPRALAQIAGMPVDINDWKPLQVLDTSSSNFGRFFFLPNYDVPGDPSKIIRS